MRLGNVAAGLSALVLSLGCGQGSAQQTHAESPTTPGASNEKTSSEPSAASEYRSEQYAFRWRIPDDWEFVPLEEMGATNSHPGIEQVVARPRNDEGVTTVVLQVRGVLVPPGKKPGDGDELEKSASETLQAVGVPKKTRSARLRLLGADAIRVDGVKDYGEGVSLHAAVLVFYKNRREFSLRCYSDEYVTGVPCGSALGGLVIDEMPDSPESSTRPRVLHLRDDKFRIQFDAPDDGWLAIGPRTAIGGAQVLWIWNKDGRQVDVQVTDLATMAQAVDEATFVPRMADKFRESGATVTVKQSQLSGKPCSHIEVRRTDGYQQDMFLQKRGGFLYGMMVTVPKLDAALIARAKAGYKVLSSD